MCESANDERFPGNAGPEEVARLREAAVRLGAELEQAGLGMAAAWLSFAVREMDAVIAGGEWDFDPAAEEEDGERTTTNPGRNRRFPS